MSLGAFLKYSLRFADDIELCSRAYAEASTLGEWVKAGWCAHDVASDYYALLTTREEI